MKVVYTFIANRIKNSKATMYYVGCLVRILNIFVKGRGSSDLDK